MTAPEIRSELMRIALKCAAHNRATYGAHLDYVIEVCEERAAIREHLGGMERAVAELEAIRDTCEVLGVRLAEEKPRATRRKRR